jgi:glycosyltransferase involved in cell wall biosynthesis
MKNKYILITAARNEDKFIENTILSVLSQTIKPVQWIIVNDNSTDETEQIISRHLNDNLFIKLINRKDQESRNFASKVYALNLAIKNIDIENYDFIGVLDADITFEDNYYETILKEFDRDEKLGCAGGEFFDVIGNKKFRVIKSNQSVRGGIQLFRAKAFWEIGEFKPLRYGGEDVIMEVSIRKNGWKVKSFDHQMLEHHRPTGTGGWNIFEAKFREGILAYSMGYHPLFQIVKSVYRFKERPIIIAGILHLMGFIYANIKHEARPVTEDFIKYLRSEQIGRIKSVKL